MLLIYVKDGIVAGCQSRFERCPLMTCVLDLNFSSLPESQELERQVRSCIRDLEARYGSITRCAVTVIKRNTRDGCGWLYEVCIDMRRHPRKRDQDDGLLSPL